MLKSDSSSKTLKKTAAGANRKKAATTNRPKKAGVTDATSATPQTERAALREPTHDEIARRAYELYRARGSRDGRASDDWLRAERELRGERSRARPVDGDGGAPKGNA